MTRILILGIGLLVITIFFGCGTSNPVLATIGDEKISLHEFEDNYAKNNGGWDTSATSSLEDRQKFLDLVIKFKLKVKEARAQGLEKDTAIIDEMKTYVNSVAQSYMIEKEVVEPGIKQFYNRKKEEVHASHILFRLSLSAKPADTLMVYQRAMNAIAQISSTPFDTLAYKLSEDPSAKKNYGDLGYFSGGRMIMEFEDACYSLKPGEYTKVPIRTSYGYHVIKVHERRVNRGSVHLSHILLKFNESTKDSSFIRDTAWMIYNQLSRGGNFSELVKKYSKDQASAIRDGDIGSYDYDRIPPAVSDIIYKTPVGSITEPIRFNYGYHIFKPSAKKNMPEYDEIKKDLRTSYQQMRYKDDYNKYINSLKVKYRVNVDSSAVKTLIASIDTAKLAGEERWKDMLSAKMLATKIIFYSGNPFTVEEFSEKVINSDELKSYKLTPANIWLIVAKITDVVALEERGRHAMEEYPALTELMKEYEDGILLYRIEQDEVWKKIPVSDSLLKKYYDKTKENYRWPDRVNFAEIFVAKDSTAKVIYRQLKRGKNFMNMAQEYTVRPDYKEKKGEWGLQIFSLNDLSRKASKMVKDSITEPFRYEGGWSIIKKIAVDSARIKTFEEAISEVTSGYQEIASKEREQQWIEMLYKKYPVQIQKEVLAAAFKRKQVEYK